MNKIMKALWNTLKKSFYNNQELEKVSNQNNEYNINIEAEKIAEKIKTFKGIEALKDKVYQLEDKLSEYTYNKTMSDKTEYKIAIVDKALEIINNTPYRYYYCDDVDMNTPTSILPLVGKVITPKRFKEIDDEYKVYFEVVLFSDYSSDEEIKEEALEYLTDNTKEVIKLRKIFESNIDIISKEKKFDSLVLKSDFLKEMLNIDEDEDISYYNTYTYNIEIEDKINKFGDVSLASLFVRLGYESIEDIKKLSDKEILSIDGVGIKTLEYIRKL